jgi:phosphatidylglycerol lysyltransferase
MFSITSPSSTIRAFSNATRPRSTPAYLVSESRAADTPQPNISQRLNLIRKYGDFTLAYSTAVQSRLRYFGDEHGYIAYDRHSLGYTFVLGDPVAAPKHRERLIEQFVAQHRGTAFCQISATTARTLQQCGFYVNEMGVDTVLPLLEFDFQSRENKWLRHAATWTSQRGFTTREETMEQVDANQVESVSLAWRATRCVKHKEVRFLNRPMVMPDEPGTRRFYFYDAEQQMLAFVFFDPLFRAGQLIGYVACTKRRHPDAPTYAEQAIMKHAIEVFQSEGFQELRLGLSPLAWIEDREYRSNWLVNKMFRYSFSSKVVNKFFYNVQGHANYKRRFRGREEKLYFATGARFNIVRLMALLKICKVV